jgi:hypothetical protein
MLKQEVLYFLAALDKRVSGLWCRGNPLKKKGTNFGDGEGELREGRSCTVFYR